MNVLITGATGFVGHSLAGRLSHNNQVIAAVRSNSTKLPAKVEQIKTGDLAEWAVADKDSLFTDRDEKKNDDLFERVDVVVHTAARVHIMDDRATDPLAAFRQMNTAATLKLARQAAKAGVKRFIFISTIKVNGESTSHRQPFSEKDECRPEDPYGISKWEAEWGLMQVAKETGMEIVIIRPPLIYGPGVKGNFATLMRWVSRGVPLPLGAVKNQRSLLALENLLSFIELCLQHPKAANECFLLSDASDISTTELIRQLARAYDKKAKLLPVPAWCLNKLLALLGKSEVADRVLGSLQLDCSKAKSQLGWEPAVTMDEQLKKMVEKKTHAS